MDNFREDHVAGGSVGELTRTVLLEQFTALRDGDRLWYQNLFSGRQLREIDNTRLSDVIERNTELTSIQDDAFVVPGERTNWPGDDRNRPRPPRDAAPIDPSVASPGDEVDDGDAQPPDDTLPRPPVPQPVGDNDDGGNRRGPRPPQQAPVDVENGNGEDEEEGGRGVRGMSATGVDQIFADLGNR